MKIIFCLSLMMSISAFATCKVTEVRKIKGLYKVRFKHELAVGNFNDCLERAHDLLGRVNVEPYKITRRSGKNHQHRHTRVIQAHMTTVKIIAKYTGGDIDGKSLSVRYLLEDE